MSKTPKLRFKEFSGDWKQVKIGEVSKINGRIGFRGYTTADIVKKEYGALSLSPSNIVNSKLFLDKENTYISIEKYEESPEIMVFNNDIVFVKTGSTFGKVALVENLNEKATLNPQLVVLKDIEIPPKLLSIIMASSKIQRQVQGAKGGGVVPTLTQKELAEYKFYIPNKYKEQEKIASFFSLIDDKISLQGEKLKMLKDYKKGMMQKIFSRELRFKDDEGRDYPEWEEKKLGGLLKSVSSGKTKSKNEVGTYNVYGSMGVIGYTEDKDYEGEHILIARVGANAGTVNIIDEPCGVSDNTLVMKCNDEIDCNFLYHKLNQYNLSRLVFGSGQPLITGGQVKGISIDTPTLEEQLKIARYLHIIEAKLQKEQEKLDSLNEYKKGLLQQMFV